MHPRDLCFAAAMLSFHGNKGVVFGEMLSQPGRPWNDGGFLNLKVAAVSGRESMWTIVSRALSFSCAAVLALGESVACRACISCLGV